MAMAMVWQDPPGLPYEQITGKWAEQADALREHPGKWALLTERRDRAAASQMAYHIKRGTLKAFRPAGAFEAAGRGLEVYVRYVGDQ